jgi:hypothetical protein
VNQQFNTSHDFVQKHEKLTDVFSNFNAQVRHRISPLLDGSRSSVYPWPKIDRLPQDPWSTVPLSVPVEVVEATVDFILEFTVE